MSFTYRPGRLDSLFAVRPQPSHWCCLRVCSTALGRHHSLPTDDPQSAPKRPTEARLRSGLPDSLKSHGRTLWPPWALSESSHPATVECADSPFPISGARMSQRRLNADEGVNFAFVPEGDVLVLIRAHRFYPGAPIVSPWRETEHGASPMVHARANW